MNSNPVLSSMLEAQWAVADRNKSAAEKRVAEYLRAHGKEVISMPLSEISHACNVSDATVVRFCRHLGYKGLKDFKIAIAKEQSTAELCNAAPIRWDDTTSALKEKVFSGCAMALQCSCKTLSDESLAQAVQALSAARNIDIYAVGGSAPIASYFRHQLIKLGIRSSVYSDAINMKLSQAQLGKRDVALAISCSGKTQEVVRALSAAAALKATTICLTNSRQAPLAREASICLITSGNRFFGEDYNTYSRLSQLAVVDILYAGLLLQKNGRPQAAPDKPQSPAIPK